MIVVHHLNESRSQRILWLLEELGVPYEIKPYRRDATTMLAPPELRGVHPLGKSPVITDGKRTVAESGAIVDYLVRHYGKGRFQPDPSSPAYEDYVHWLHYAEGSAMLPLMLLLYTTRLGDAGAPLKPRIDGEIGNHLGYLEQALAGRQFIVGDDHGGGRPDHVRRGAGEDVRPPRRLPEPDRLRRPHARAAGVSARGRAGRAVHARRLSAAVRTSRQRDVHVLHPAIGLAGRVMFTLIFFLSGITHFTDLPGYVALLPAATPFPTFWVLVSGVTELVGAALVVGNRYPRLGAWMIFVFLVPVTIVVHGVAMVMAPDAQMRQIQTSFFLKGVAMAGAALLVTQLGVTRAAASPDAV